MNAEMQSAPLFALALVLFVGVLFVLLLGGVRVLRVRWHTLAWLRAPLAAFVVTRGVLIIFGWFVDIVASNPPPPLPWSADDTSSLFSLWTRWDGMWYLQIIRDGYSFDPQGQSSVAFFPLYPVAARLLVPLVGDPVAAGVLVANGALLAALLVLYRLTLLEFRDEAAAARTVFIAACAPTGYFFTALYTESTFLLCAVAAFYAARRGRWLGAGVWGALTTLARLAGAAIALPLALEWLRPLLPRARWLTGVRPDAVDTSRQADAPPAAPARLSRTRHIFGYGLAFGWLALIPLALGGYMVYCAYAYGDPLAFLTTVRAGWFREARNPLDIIAGEWDYISRLVVAGERSPVMVIYGFNMALFWTVCAIGLAAWRRLGASYGVYTLLIPLIHLSGGSVSMSRYLVVIFPVYMMLGVWARSPLVERALLVGGALMMGMLTTLFVNGWFIA